MRPRVTLRDALGDPDLLGHVMSGDSWRPHRILSIAAMGEALTAEERVIFQKFTGRDHEPGERVSEFCTIAGRRTGKTVTMGMLAAYLAACVDYSDVLIRGETGVLLALSQDQRVAGQLLSLVEENLNGSPILKQLIVNRTADAIELEKSHPHRGETSKLQKTSRPDIHRDHGGRAVFLVRRGALCKTPTWKCSPPLAPAC